MNTHLIRAYLLISLACAFIQNSVCQEPRSSNKPTEASICTIQEDPARYEKILVRVRLRVRSDGIERTGADDASCPDKIVRLSLQDGASDYPGVDTLRAVIFSGRPGTVDKEVLATIIGSVGNENDGQKGVVIRVLRVELIEVRLRKDQ